jgi:hypothetical protein
MDEYIDKPAQLRVSVIVTVSPKEPLSFLTVCLPVLSTDPVDQDH